MNDSTDKACFVICMIMALVAVPIGIDWVSSREVFLGTGVVNQTVYVPATHSHGTATTLDKNSTMVMTSSSTYEQWQAIVTVGSKTFSVDVPANDWGQLKPGGEVDVYEYRGRIFGGHFRKFVKLKGQ